jgi:thiol-disulfide isomerase/thioredoxin
VIAARALLAVSLMTAGWAITLWFNRWRLARLRQRELGLPGYQPGLPAILYFTTPGCQPCRTVQKPALEKLRGWLGAGLQVIEVDASAESRLADHWGVLSVPTTFVIDSRGEPKGINHGVALAEKLLTQLEAAEERRLLPTGQAPHTTPKPDYN